MKDDIRLAAVGDNCIDLYDQTGDAYPGGNPVNVAVYTVRLGVAPPIPAWWGMTNMADSCGRLWRPKGWTYPTCTPSPAPPPCPT